MQLSVCFVYIFGYFFYPAWAWEEGKKIISPWKNTTFPFRFLPHAHRFFFLVIQKKTTEILENSTWKTPLCCFCVNTKQGFLGLSLLCGIFCAHCFFMRPYLLKPKQVNVRHNQNSAIFNLCSRTFRCVCTNVHLISHDTEDKRRQMPFSGVSLTLYFSVIFRSDSPSSSVHTHARLYPLLLLLLLSLFR